MQWPVPLYHGEDAGLTHWNLNPYWGSQEDACSGAAPPGTGVNGTCRLAAYKLHHHDHIAFSADAGGLQLVWRNGEPGSTDTVHGAKCGHVDKPPPRCPQESLSCPKETELASFVFAYEWDRDARRH